AGAEVDAAAERGSVDVARDGLGELALHELRDAAGELDDLESAVDLAERIRRDLAVLAGQERGDVLLVFLDELAVGEEDARPAGERGLAPAGEGLLRGRDRRVDVPSRTQRDPPRLLSGARVVGRTMTAIAVDELAPDPVCDVAHVCSRNRDLYQQAVPASINNDRSPWRTGARRPGRAARRGPARAPGRRARCGPRRRGRGAPRPGAGPGPKGGAPPWRMPA